jgi:hypothetical protein
MPDRPPIRVVVTEAAFRQLCAGQIVQLVSPRGESVELILSDIGIVPMLRAVCDGVWPKEREISNG